MGVFTYAPVLPSFSLSRLDKFSHYHTHPVSVLEKVKGRLIKPWVEQQGLELDEGAVNHFLSLYAALPSYADIEGFLKFIQKNPNSYVDFRIISPNGMTLLNFNKFEESELAIPKYKEVRKIEGLYDILTGSKNTLECISRATEKINEGMEGIFESKFIPRA